MISESLYPETRITRWASEPEDLAQMPVDLVARIYFDICLIDKFEHAALRLKDADCVWGPIHTSVGQEATGAAVVHALRPSDKMTGTHRSHHHFLAKILQYFLPRDWQPHVNDVPEEGVIAVRRALAEVMGLSPGFCGGRGGSMHLRCEEAGFLGSNAIVAGGMPLATGVAFAEKRHETGNLVVCYFGDGAVNQGAFHEACNFAGAWDLPMIFFLENNFYAVGTRTDSVSAVSEIARRGASYGMDTHIVDGSDPVALFHVARLAAAAVRERGKPVFIEARCYRTYHHAGGQTGSAFKYRSEEEERYWVQRQPIVSFPKQVRAAGILDEATLNAIRLRAEKTVCAAVDFCTDSASPPRVRAELWPSPESAGEGLRSDGIEWQGALFREREDFTKWRKVRFSDIIAASIERWLEREPEALVLGEEVANFGGGAYGATKNLPQRYPKSVLNTPISEAGFIGLGAGAAMSGMRPIAEIMFPDFSLVAADQLFNVVAKARHMYGNTTQLPLVVRIRIATGCGYGAQHSMDPVGLYALFPGWRIVAPSTAFDYIGLFNSAMRSLDPVLILEHHSLYGQHFKVPTDDIDYMVRLGKARTIVPGDDITVVTYGAMVERCARLANRWREVGVSAEVIDLRTLDLWSLDYATLGSSLTKTGQLAIVEQAAASQGIGKQIAAVVQERFFDELDGPSACIASLDIAPSVSRVLENSALLDDETIFRRVTAVARRQWK
jgi:2-oxoisovalerate dehydrogenase E1 component